MAQQTLNNGASFGTQRQKINDNFTELYTDVAGAILASGAGTISDKTFTNTDSLTFDTTPTSTVAAVGKLVWNDTDGTLNLGLKGNAVNLQIGQEQVLRVYNTSGATLSSGDVVYITGSSGSTRLTVSKADASAEATSANTIGVVTETILNNQEGFATVNGLVRDINTVGFTEGAAIYLSTTAGLFTGTKPTAPDHATFLGFVVRAHSTLGSIFVNVINGYELDEMHDVHISAIANGNLLGYNSANSRWENISSIDNINIGLTTRGSGAFTTLDSSSKMGYSGTDSGGTVTQITSKQTGVTLNKASGQITLAASSIAANTTNNFSLVNSSIAANDTVIVNVKSGGTLGAYSTWVSAVSAGSCYISIRNMTAGSLAEAPILQFNVIKGSIA